MTLIIYEIQHIRLQYTVELLLSGHSFLQWKKAINHEWPLKAELTLVSLVTNLVR